MYVLPHGPTPEVLLHTADRWALEVYRTLMGTLRSVAAVLLALFVAGLIAYLVLRARELQAQRRAPLASA